MLWKSEEPEDDVNASDNFLILIYVVQKLQISINLYYKIITLPTLLYWIGTLESCH